MNLQEIYKMQQALDLKFALKLQFQPAEVAHKRILALLVEIGEFANEVMSFKYWKRTKKVNHQKLLEEFVDGIHFFTSIALELKASSEIMPLILETDLNFQILALFRAVIELQTKYTKAALEYAYRLYFGVAEILKISDHEITAAYNLKNKVNYQRIKDGY